MNAKSLLIGMLTGTAVGAAATLLSTPLSGQEARQKVKVAQSALKSNAQVIKKEAEQVKQAVIHLKDVSKDNIGEVADGLKVSAGIWKESTEPNIQKLQQDVVEVQKTVEDLQKALPARK
ncbi:hypothetical protein AC623_03555 [Bacillus sp. FJAT-27231]|uniref:YtxH domain-containing protein n=1 Tax=Bacillus sp. FJAT-27231 TaxID=1679168 RepID=UPI0006717355|nr:YtxH domain-containing protein [Bacillus sp. FJAT-27231]KMY53172.1 hypothetical protein AC623_03555 [Bacillus sp. FJAT-27231]